MRIPSRLTPRLLFVILPLALSLPLAGCGKSTGTVSGKVLYKNAPLKGGKVIYFLENNQTAVSEIQEDGTYKLDKPIPTGTAKVAVITSSLRPQPSGPGGAPRYKPPADMAHPESFTSGDAGASAKRYTAIPMKYETPDQSGLQYTIKTGANDIEIKLE
jgi:hypothetical protein